MATDMSEVPPEFKGIKSSVYVSQENNEIILDQKWYFNWMRHTMTKIDYTKK